MKIKIEQKNADAIESALAAVNGKAESFAITSFRVVLHYAEKAETQLEHSRLPKAERTGVKVNITPEGPAAKSYGYRVKSTEVSIERGSTGWFLVNVATAIVYPKQAHRFQIKISEAQRNTIAAKAIADYTVVKAPVSNNCVEAVHA